MTASTIDEVILVCADEEFCKEALRNYKWPETEGIPICPKCRSTRAVEVKGTPKFRCRECESQFSYKAGTFCERSHIALRHWIVAIWMLDRPERKMTAKALAEKLGIRHDSAAFMLTRLRSWKQRHQLKSAA